MLLGHILPEQNLCLWRGTGLLCRLAIFPATPLGQVFSPPCRTVLILYGTASSSGEYPVPSLVHFPACLSPDTGCPAFPSLWPGAARGQCLVSSHLYPGPACQHASSMFPMLKSDHQSLPYLKVPRVLQAQHLVKRTQGETQSGLWFSLSLISPLDPLCFIICFL